MNLFQATIVNEFLGLSWACSMIAVFLRSNTDFSLGPCDQGLLAAAVNSRSSICYIFYPHLNVEYEFFMVQNAR